MSAFREEFMKTLILILTAIAVFAQKPGDPKSGGGPAGNAKAPSVPSTAETAPKPELFRDPFRKVKNAKGELVNADLRPLFAWFQTRRGKRPMEAWNRFILTTIESTREGVVVSNSLDNKTFFLRNYPYKV